MILLLFLNEEGSIFFLSRLSERSMKLAITTASSAPERMFEKLSPALILYARDLVLPHTLVAAILIPEKMAGKVQRTRTLQVICLPV